MGGNNADNNNKSSLGDTVKKVWKALPKSVKLYILGGVGAVILLFILAAAIMGLVPSNFLYYSDEVQGSNEISAEYEEYWSELCSEGDESCSYEEISKANELRASQKKFFDKLDSLVKKYKLTPEEKYMVLTTVFFDVDIEEFTEGNGAYEIDDNDEIDYETGARYDENTGQNVYERERDSLKELIKQFQVTTAFCSYNQPVENGEGSTTSTFELIDSENKTFSFTFFDRVKMVFGDYSNNEGFKTVKEDCENRDHGQVYFEETTDSQASIDGFYNYLRESDYFDDKPNLQSYFTSYGNTHKLNEDISTWAEEERQEVRQEIIKSIQDIVKWHMEQNNLEVVVTTGNSYWWPIGSTETTTSEDGVLFASGTPESTIITSKFGMRVHPTTGIYSFHDGVDLSGTMGSTNIIAALGGTVINVVNECASSNSSGCGGGYGNYVEIQDNKGNVSMYAHMYKDSQTVAIGDVVQRGQVLGKVGSSGNSTGPHLHFNIKVNGTYQEPLDYIDITDTRPSGGEGGDGSVDFHNSRYSEEEFIAKVKDYYSSGDVCKSASKQYVNGCNSFRDEVLNNNGAKIIYDIASEKNLNPELVVGRSALEGYSPGTNYNYFGYTCYNEGGLAVCTKFSSFKSAMEAFFKKISQYDSLKSMMSRYASLGEYWFTGVHWAWGGCVYASYIYPDGVPDRVQAACNHPDGYCSINNKAGCTATTQEDKDAYTDWQVKIYANVLNKIFG